MFRVFPTAAWVPALALWVGCVGGPVAPSDGGAAPDATAALTLARPAAGFVPSSRAAPSSRALPPPASALAPAPSEGAVGSTAISPENLPPKMISPTRALSLAETLALAMERNPTFAEFEANRDAARAQVVQSLLYPNPEAEVSVGMARSLGESSGELAPEFGVSFLQPVESPSKRRARRAAAEAALPVVENEARVFQLTVRKDATQAYWNVVYQEEARRLAEADARLASETEEIVARRVEGGEASKTDRIKARLEALRARRGVRVAERRIGIARIALDALCGGALGSDFMASDSLESEGAQVELEALLRQAEAHPLLSRLDAMMDRQRAAIERERTHWYPDLRPALHAGHETDKDTIAVSLGMELPLFNRNQGGIAEARAELARLEAERRKTELEIRRDVLKAWEAQQGALEQRASFSPEMRRDAADALRLATLLYENGETDLLPLIEARRTAQGVETEYLQALYDATLARSELERAGGIR